MNAEVETVNKTELRLTGNIQPLAGLGGFDYDYTCLLYTSPSPRDRTRSRMPSSA